MGRRKNRRRLKNRVPVLGLFLAGLCLLLGPPGVTTAQTQPPSGVLNTYFPLVLNSGPLSWPTISLNPVVGGLTQPTSITHAGDNSARIFITEQPGRIRIIKNDALQTTPFLDITGRIGSGGERGLLSVAFPRVMDPSRTTFTFFIRTRSEHWSSPATGRRPTRMRPIRAVKKSS